MDEQKRLVEQFERQRSHLRSVAYRMLGSLAEADDAVQETWLRLSQSESPAVENLRAWLTTIIARVSLNKLRARKSHREASIAHLPDPVITLAAQGRAPWQGGGRRSLHMTGLSALDAW